MLVSADQLIRLVNDAESKQEGIWVRLKNELKICLIKVADDEHFVGKFFPCAKNSRQYAICIADIWSVEKSSDGAPLRYSSAVDHSAQSGG